MSTQSEIGIYITVGIYSIAPGYICLVKSHDFNIELLTILTDNICRNFMN